MTSILAFRFLYAKDNIYFSSKYIHCIINEILFFAFPQKHRTFMAINKYLFDYNINI